MFELNQLRCFVAVATELHFGRAAGRLNMTQPPLSRQIQLLEHTLGVKLFDRTNRRVVLTVPGQTFLPEAVRLLKLADSAAASVRRSALGETGSVAIGFTATSGYDFLPRALRHLQVEMPNVDVVLYEAVTNTHMEGLRSDGLDLALARPTRIDSGIASQVVLREPLVVALPQGHELEACSAISVRQLGDQRIVGYSPHEAKYFHDILIRLFTTQDVSLHVTQHVSQVHSVLALVRAGLGVGLVPSAATHLRFSGVVFRPLDSSHGVTTDLTLFWRPDNRNPAAALGRDLLLSMPHRT